MIIHILITIGFYLVLLYLSVNLLGYFVRGFFVNPELDLLRLKREGYSDEFINNSLAMGQKKNDPAAKRLNIVITIIAFVLIVLYFYLLNHFWNWGVVLVAVLIIVGRLPDLIWEIKHGKKITRDIAKALPKNALYYISAFLPWLGLPVLYYSLYHLGR